MDLKDKLSLIAQALDAEPEALKPETKLEELEEWDSLAVVSVIAMLDKHFSVRLKPNDIKSLVTVEDILAHMKGKKRLKKLTINPMSLSGKNIIVTGASSGIGLATSHLICALGGNVAMVSRSKEKLSVAQRKCLKNHRRPFPLTYEIRIKYLI